MEQQIPGTQNNIAEFSNIYCFNLNSLCFLRVHQFYIEIEPEKASYLMELLSLSSLVGITVSQVSNEFVLHRRREQDLRFITNAQRTQLVDLIVNQTFESDLKIKFFLATQKELTDFVGTENENEDQLLLRLQNYQINLLQKISLQRILQDQSRIQKNIKDLDQIDDYVFHRVLGKGKFGRVYHVTHCRLKEDFAMKVLKKSFIFKKGLSENILIEKNLLLLKSSFIINLHHSFQDNKRVYFVMDLMKGGDLFTHLKKQQWFTEEQTRFFISGVLLGMNELQKRNVILRDLKPENILLNEKAYPCLGDFGLAKILDQQKTTDSFCGTEEYLSPERVLWRSYDRSSDFWALGMLTYELLFGWTAFWDKDPLKQSRRIIEEPLRFPQDIQCSSEARSFIFQLLAKSSKNWLGSKNGLQDLVQHPWLVNQSWKELLVQQMRSPYADFEVSNWEKNFEQLEDISGVSLSSHSRSYQNQTIPDLSFKADLKFDKKVYSFQRDFGVVEQPKTFKYLNNVL